MSLTEWSRAVETWTVTKPTVRAAGGLVASQHHHASEVGARVLAAGGNAVDAAVATGLAIGTVEPWMSGLGGGGYMLVYVAAERRVHAVEFGMVAPRALDPADYPLSGGVDSDLFGWPGVVEDRNVVGPTSIAVPGYVDGVALALERFGTLSWAEALAPAIESAHRGMSVDWYATLKIASAARTLARFPESARVYLPDGFAPSGEWGGPLPSIRLGRLAETLERLAAAGPRDFYEGAIAADLLADLEAMGNRIAAADLAAVRARMTPVEPRPYRDAKVHAAPGLSAGPTLLRTLELVESRLAPGRAPDTSTFLAYAESLSRAYAERLERLGDAGDSTAHPSCTTHLGVVDADGNMVALTQTLLSIFGSKVVLPRTGILMNNGVMWFDPRPGRPNSIGSGKRPLSNMCPTIVELADGRRAALGASGGRRIMPAVMQLVSFLVDFRMDLDAAVHHGRIDFSGAPLVVVDERLDPAIAAAIAERHTVHRARNGVYPALFACPNVVVHDPAGPVNEGGAYVPSPWAKVVAAGPPAAG